MSVAAPPTLYIPGPLGNGRDGKIQLGAVFDHPLKVFQFPIAQAPVTLAQKSVGPPQAIKDLVHHKAKVWGVALWAKFLSTFGFQIEAGHAHDKAMTFSSKRVVTEELSVVDILKFINDLETSSPTLKARIDKAPVYMVVGVKYADNLQYKIVQGERTGVAADGHGSPNEHVTIGGYLFYLGSTGYLHEGSVNGESAFAYMMLEISRHGWWKKVTKTKVVQDGTLLGSDSRDSDSDEDEEEGEEEQVDIKYISDEDMLVLAEMNAAEGSA
ncbi:hypothetical protein AUP68_10079 [Ilyonectria robusta]